MVELFGHIRTIYERDKPRLALEAGFPKFVPPFNGDARLRPEVGFSFPCRGLNSSITAENRAILSFTPARVTKRKIC
jgi:hypothetical protein